MQPLPEPQSSSDPAPLAFAPVARFRAATRGLLWAAPAALFGVIAVHLVRAWFVAPNALESRLVTLSTVVIALPFPILALICGFVALRWLLLAAWPRRLGVFACRDGLDVRLGPFGRWRFAAQDLTIRYLFELPEEELGEAGFEAYLPEEEQVRRFVPRIEAKTHRRPVNSLFTRFLSADERIIAEALRPAVDYWRSRMPT